MFKFGDRVQLDDGRIGVLISNEQDSDGEFQVHFGDGCCGWGYVSSRHMRHVSNDLTIQRDLLLDRVNALEEQRGLLRRDLADSDKVIDSLRTQLEMTQVRFNKALDLLSRDQLAELIAKIITNP